MSPCQHSRTKNLVLTTQLSSSAVSAAATLQIEKMLVLLGFRHLPRQRWSFDLVAALTMFDGRSASPTEPLSTRPQVGIMARSWALFPRDFCPQSTAEQSLKAAIHFARDPLYTGQPRPTATQGGAQ